MEVRFGVYFKKNLGTLFKNNLVDKPNNPIEIKTADVKMILL